MYILVQPLKGLKKQLWYHVPQEYTTPVGTIVTVPLQQQTIPAIVFKQVKQVSATYQIKSIVGVETFPSDPHYTQFLSFLENYYQISSLLILRRIRQFVEQKKELAQQLEPSFSTSKAFPSLTPQQQAVYQELAPAIQKNTYAPSVLHGVTGSGKTVVYKHLLRDALSQGKAALLLLPEVTLALQFELRMREHFAHEQVFGFHSGTSTKEKKALWNKLIVGEAIIIVGVHLPALLPIANLGLIIIDEEHEMGFQEKKHPKINSREAALLRAKLANVPIILGSATPSLHSLYQHQINGWKWLTLSERFSGKLPTIQQVSLVDKKQRGPHFLLSKPLENAIKEQLQKKEQTILFLNRRGFCFFVQCKQCSFIFYCNRCSVSLTLHNASWLHCHYCDSKLQLPLHCPSCKKDAKNFIKKGIGTQRVVHELQKLFPTATIARADLDTTKKKREWEQTLAQFNEGKIAILVGTQTVTKGFHFPHLTLVGVLWADSNLHMPVFNAAERTLQQILQVAGRAGRVKEESKVIVQTVTQHPLFSHLDEMAYLDFCHQELALRKKTYYPPFYRLVEIELKHTSEEIVVTDSEILATELEKNALQICPQIEILGPSQPIVSKIKNWHSRKIYIKSNSFYKIVKIYRTIDIANFKSSIFFTPNPLSL